MTITNKNFSEYDHYIKEHRQNVKNAFEWLKLTILPSFLDKEKINSIEKLINYHDLSKYSVKEFFAYNDYFFEREKGKNEEDFKYAWLHHIHHNPHHWEHWVICEEGGEPEALDIPIQHIVEMICDWWSFSWKVNNLHEIFDWYSNNKEDMFFSKNTKSTIEAILKEIEMQLYYEPLKDPIFNEGSN